MTAEKLQKNITIDEVNHLIDGGHVYRFQFAINREVYIISNHKPSKVMVTDMSVKGIQLNGQWYSEKALEDPGGSSGSEFEALSALQ